MNEPERQDAGQRRHPGIEQNLEGAVLLLMLDARGLERFALTVEGFYRSFLAALYVLPLYVFVWIAERQFRLVEDGEIPVGVSVPLVTVEALYFVAQWITFPIVMVGVVRLLQLEARYVPYIIASNWAGVLAYGVQVLPLLIWGLGLADQGATVFLAFATFIFSLYVRWAVAYMTLGIGPVMAGGVALLDLLVGLWLLAGFSALMPEGA